MQSTLKKQVGDKGFTLLELLIAISIFSTLSVMAYSGLKTILDTRDSSERVADRIAKIQISMLRLNNDLTQAVSRKVRDGFGVTTMMPAMMTSLTDISSLEWTRSGYRNPGKVIRRSNLQRIAYKLDKNGNLIREAWPVLDRTQTTEPIKSILLTNVEKVEWKFNVKKDSWESSWPTAAMHAVSTLGLLPKAVNINITFTDIGEVHRTIIIPQG